MNKTHIIAQMPSHPMAHCATITELSNGSLLAAWYAGSREGATDVAIFSSGYRAGSWSTPQVMVQIAGHSVGQPIFLPRPNGEVWLFFVIIGGLEPPSAMRRALDAVPVGVGWNRAQPFWQRSIDNGRTWEAPQQLMDYPGLMFRSRPLILPGRILLPVYDENTWQSRMLISDDDGQSWQLTHLISSPSGNIQPSLVQLSDGRTLAYLRTGGKGGWIWRTTSSDGGETWAEPTPTALPNPNSGIDLIRTQNGKLVVVYNPTPRQRTPLVVSVASEKEDWQPGRVLEEGPGEFSYPALLQAADESIHLVYTYKRQTILHARFTESWLAERKSEHDV